MQRAFNRAYAGGGGFRRVHGVVLTLVNACACFHTHPHIFLLLFLSQPFLFCHNGMPYGEKSPTQSGGGGEKCVSEKCHFWAALNLFTGRKLAQKLSQQSLLWCPYGKSALRCVPFKVVWKPSTALLQFRGLGSATIPWPWCVTSSQVFFMKTDF